MSLSEDEILNETVQQIGNLPVVVCVVELPGEVYALGYAVSKPANFDLGVAPAICKRNARKQAPLIKQRITRT